MTRCGTWVPAGPSKKVGVTPSRCRCNAGNCWRTLETFSMATFREWRTPYSTRFTVPDIVREEVRIDINTAPDSRDSKELPS
jgi:hypothetical protein